MIINIRGTNGSGKTTLARNLIGSLAQPVDLVQYTSPTKRDPLRQRFVEGWGGSDFLAVGSYKQGCGGMDTIPSFELQQQAVETAWTWSKNGKPITGPAPRHVICEGVLSSTVAGSWLEFFGELRSAGAEVLIAYLDTPLEVCLERIRQRQIASGRGEREIKVDLVKDKIKAIAATRAKFDAAGIRTVSLRYHSALIDLMEAIDA